MSTDNSQVVDVRGITTTGLTSSTTFATHLSNLAGAVRAVRTEGNDARVSKALLVLNQFADIARSLKL